MKILGIDSTAKTASVGIVEDGVLTASLMLNEGLTHSQTLLPLIDKILSENNMTISDIDAFAVNNGPGSFTGVRIGVALVKGLALADRKPCFEVSTLDSIAYNCREKTGMTVAVMDARSNRLYNACYEGDGKTLRKVIPDRPCIIEELYEDIRGYTGNVYIVGDGQTNVRDFFEAHGIQQDNFIYPEYLENIQSGANTALIASQDSGRGKPPERILPRYLRLAQAEQELRKRDRK